MDLSRFGKILLVLGTLALVGATVWWYLFFEQALGDEVTQAKECFYYTTDLCRLGSGAVGAFSEIPPYEPAAFWAAVVLAAAGAVALAVAPSGRGGK